MAGRGRWPHLYEHDLEKSFAKNRSDIWSKERVNISKYANEDTGLDDASNLDPIGILQPDTVDIDDDDTPSDGVIRRIVTIHEAPDRVINLITLCRNGYRQSTLFEVNAGCLARISPFFRHLLWARDGFVEKDQREVKLRIGHPRHTEFVFRLAHGYLLQREIDAVGPDDLELIFRVADAYLMDDYVRIAMRPATLRLASEATAGGFQLLNIALESNDGDLFLSACTNLFLNTSLGTDFGDPSLYWTRKTQFFLRRVPSVLGANNEALQNNSADDSDNSDNVSVDPHWMANLLNQTFSDLIHEVFFPIAEIHQLATHRKGCDYRQGPIKVAPDCQCWVNNTECNIIGIENIPYNETVLMTRLNLVVSSGITQLSGKDSYGREWDMSPYSLRDVFRALSRAQLTKNYNSISHGRISQRPPSLLGPRAWPTPCWYNDSMRTIGKKIGAYGWQDFTNSAGVTSDKGPNGQRRTRVRPTRAVMSSLKKEVELAVACRGHFQDPWRLWEWDQRSRDKKSPRADAQ